MRISLPHRRRFIRRLAALLGAPVAAYMGSPPEARIWDFSRPGSAGGDATGYTLAPRGGLHNNGPVS